MMFRMALVDIFTQMEAITKENGRMEKHMAREYLKIHEVQYTQASGEMTKNLVSEMKSGLTDPLILANTSTALSMVRGITHGQTGIHILDSIIKIE